MPPRDFLPVDGAAALLSIAEVVGAGFVLGQAYEDAGPWITLAGVVALLAVAFIVARFLRRS
jgi:membrane protein DedA with SNARE-associated domain